MDWLVPLLVVCRSEAYPWKAASSGLLRVLDARGGPIGIDLLGVSGTFSLSERSSKNLVPFGPATVALRGGVIGVEGEG